MKKIELTEYVKIKFHTPGTAYSEWFGYYNYDTLNADCSMMLCNRASFDGVAPQKGMTIDVGYYSLSDGVWHKISTTDSWNWQQGAMAQWLPTHDKSNQVIFNTSRQNHLVSKIVNLETREERDIDWTIYGITPDGKKSIALEMERSRWCRAYHYKSVENYSQEGRIIDSDGIFEIDLSSNQRKRIVSIHDVVAMDADSDFDNKKHWLEHIMISPQGRRFCFLHRFSDIDNVFNYTTRLCIADCNGENLQVIPGWRKFKWTHFGWKSDDEFVIYTYTKPRFYSKYDFRESLAKKACIDIFKSLYCAVASRMPYPVNYILNDNRSYYQLYRADNKHVFAHVEDWQRSYFTIDGHPSFTLDGRYMITDSYPDKNGYQRLIVFDTRTRRGIIIAKFFAFYKGNPASCDLHPKLCKNGKYVVIDTAYDEKHHMLLLELDWNKIKNRIS